MSDAAEELEWLRDALAALVSIGLLGPIYGTLLAVAYTAVRRSPMIDVSASHLALPAPALRLLRHALPSPAPVAGEGASMSQEAAPQAPGEAPPIAPHIPTLPAVFARQDAIDAPVMPAAQWLPWVDAAPHCMVVARTGGGKSVTASAIIAHRVAARNDAVAIIDIHYSPVVNGSPKWGGVTPAATDAPGAVVTLRALRAEYDRRMAALASGAVQEGDFSPVTILIDEVPELVAELDRIDRDVWGDTVGRFGSGARKVCMSCVLLTQSHLVQDIGLNSKMRLNFTVVALDAPTIAALAGRAHQPAAKWPACMEHDGQIHNLDRGDLPAIAQRLTSARAWVSPVRVAPNDGQEDALLSLLLGKTEPFGSEPDPVPADCDAETVGSETDQQDAPANDAANEETALTALLKAAKKAGLSRDKAVAMARDAGHRVNVGKLRWGEL